MRGTLERYKAVWHTPGWSVSLLCGLVIFGGGFLANFFAIQFATDLASNPVADIILSNTPVFEVDGMFIWGTVVMAGFTALVLFSYPNRIPYGLLALGTFMIIRSLFTSLTHSGPFETDYMSDFGETITAAFFGADHFFSGHAGMPFLGALAFWHRPYIRNTYITASLYFAVVVLLGHIHYSIDVLAAFFITYAIHHLVIQLYKKEWNWFR